MTTSTDPLDRRSIDHRRLRAALRLIFDGETVDRMVTAVPPHGDIERSISRLVLPAVTRFTLARWFSRIRGKDTPSSSDHPLSPTSGASAQGAVALVLHLGLDLDARLLARLFRTDVERIAHDLLRARQAVSAAVPTPCREYRLAAGSFRDRAISLNDRLSLTAHSRDCQACAHALSESARVDRELEARIGQYEAELPARLVAHPYQRLSVWHPAAMATIGVILALAVLASGLAAATRILPDEHEPVPLLSQVSDPILSGWLLTITNQQLEAFNVATGERHSYGSWDLQWGSPMLSPDRRKVAIWSGGQRPTADERGLEVFDIESGESTFWEWTKERARTPAGWLDAETFLLVDTPVYGLGESHSSVRMRQEEDSYLIAFDIETGEERVLFYGSVMGAAASPDGSLVALRPVSNYGRWVGDSLELRPLQDGKLGEPIATIEHRLVASDRNIVWSPDSSRVYFSMISDEPLPTRSPIGNVPGFDVAPVKRIDLVSLDREGQLTYLTETETRQQIVAIGVSPDGQRVVAVRGLMADDQPEWHYVIFYPDQPGRFEVLETDLTQGWWEAAVAWSPSGDVMLLSEIQPFFLGPDEMTSVVGIRGIPKDVPTNVLRAVDSDGHLLGTVGQYFFWGTPLGWLPDDLAPASGDASRALSGVFGPVETVDGLSDQYRLTADSSASPSGQFVVLSDAELDLPLIWNRERSNHRRLRSDTRDLTWLRDGTGVISGQSNQDRWYSRIALHAPQRSRTGAPFDFSRFDPAGVDDQQNHYYARPLVSPTGMAISFFVVDEDRSRVSLWISRLEKEPQQVADWVLPPDRLVEPPVVAEWVANDTLVFNVPDDWENGYPRAAVLNRLEMSNVGSLEPVELIRLRARGNERGLVLQELKLSPDEQSLAYRKRGYTRWDPEIGQVDTLWVAGVDDLASPVELARGGTGEGIAWSADSHSLVAPVRGRLAVISTDGRDTHYLTSNNAQASYPIWVTPEELWFSLDEGDGPRIMRVHAVLR